MAPTSIMAATALRDRVENRSFLAGNTGAQFFGQVYGSNFNPHLLAVSKRGDGLYYIAKGFLEGYPISGTDRIVNLRPGSIAEVVYKVWQEHVQRSLTSSYFTGAYDILSADLEVLSPGSQPRQDQITDSVSTYYRGLFVWSDQLLTTAQPWTLSPLAVQLQSN